VVVSNPVDVLTQVAWRRSGRHAGVIGDGADSARFRYLISQNCDVDVHNAHAISWGVWRQ
jgi:malate/lactate dehydrogenase